jgi:hypothetical protein
MESITLFKRNPNLIRREGNVTVNRTITHGAKKGQTMRFTIPGTMMEGEKVKLTPVSIKTVKAKSIIGPWMDRAYAR